MVDYRYLKVFMLTAKHASFSKAAQELGIAQSAISRQIKLLEQSLGQELIIRSSKKIILTANGRKLMTATQSFESNTRNIFEGEQMQNIRMGVLQGLLENWSLQILKSYYKNCDNNISIKVATPVELRAMLEDGQLDLAFTNEDIQNELVTSSKLFDETLVLISQDKVAMDQLHCYRWIVYNNDSNLVKNYRPKSPRIIVVNDISTIVQLARAGVGIAVVPNHVLEDRSNLVVVPLPAPHKSEIYLATLNFKSMPPYLSELIQLVRGQKQQILKNLRTADFFLAQH